LELAFNEQPCDATLTSGFRLTPEQKSALVAFLKTLTDESLLADPRFSDPFVRLAD
jgi:cytochrome c peroxidase